MQCLATKNENENNVQINPKILSLVYTNNKVDILLINGGNKTTILIRTALFIGFFNLDDGSDRLSRNVGKEFPFL